MKLTKKLETEIKKVMKAYWDSYLKGDLEKWASFLPDHYHNIGTNNEEEWNSKKEILDYTKKVFSKAVGLAELRNKKTHIIPYDPYIMVHEMGDIFIKAAEGWIFYAPLRLSSLLEKTRKGWQVLHQHGSYPDSKSEEGEAFGFDEMKAENKKLRDAINRRTKELEEKNRELEIEAALERVRARSMAMQKSDELAETAALLFEQIKSLGIETWTSGFNIWEKNESSFIGYNPTPTGGITAPYHIPSTENKFFKTIYEAKKRGEEFLVFESKGKSLETTYRYMKTLPVVKDVLNGIEEAGIQLPTTQVNHCVFFSHGFLLFITLEPQIEAHNIFKRFGKVFDQTYTRFLDLQKAEAQAREAEIELALERVRAKTMAMQHSDELIETSELMFEQIKNLGIRLWSCGFSLWFDDDSYFLGYNPGPEGKVGTPLRIPLTEDIFFTTIRDAKRRGDDFLVFESEGESLAQTYRYMDGLPVVGETMRGFVEAGFPLPTYQVTHCGFFSNGHLMFILQEPNPEAVDIFKRFTKVFNQTYTRFLDLQKAEAQAREAQIEAALEKVRSRSLAMHKTEELGEVITVIVEKLKELDFSVDDGVALITHIEGSKDLLEWMANPGFPSASRFYLPYFDHPVMSDLWKAKEAGLEFITNRYTGKQNKSFLNHIFKQSDYKHTPQEIKDFCLAAGSYGNAIAFQKNTAIFINDYSGRPLSESEIDIVKRFSKVFEQAYVRFLDLQKAEAQAKEAQIETALERVRSRTMGMQKSEELKEVIQVVSDQFDFLNINIEHTGFILDYKERDDMFIWLADKQKIQTQITLPYFDCAHWNSFIEARKKGENFFANHLSLKEKNKFYKDMFKVIPGIPEEAKAYYFDAAGLAISTVLLDNVGLYIENFAGTPYSDEENAILLRIGKVFQQTYTRFLDLQKAEAQAREAQVEAALERVRSRSMAMHKTDELFEAAELIYKELTSLGITSFNVSYAFVDKDKKQDEYYGVNPMDGKIFPFPVIFPQNETRVMSSIMSSWEKREPFNLIDLDEEGIKKHQTYIGGHILAQLIKNKIDVPFSVEEFVAQSPKTASIYSFNYTSGYLFIIREQKLSTDEEQIVLRFTKVFNQTYTRFLDLQKAEAQAREAQIEAALERVRSRTMGMQKSEDLNEAAADMFQQIQALGMQPWGCGFNIFDKDEKAVTQYMSLADGGISPPFRTPLTEDPFFISIHKARQQKEELLVMESKGESLAATYQYMFSLPGSGEIFGDLEKSGFEMPKFQITHCAYFSQGYLVFITYEPVIESWDIFKRFARVFEQTYTRFLDLKKAEKQTREAEINLAVERVRAKALAMHQSDEIMEVVAKLKDEVMGLNIPDVIAATIFLNEGKDKVRMWDLSSIEILEEGVQVPLDITFKLKEKDPHLYVKRVWENPADFFVEIQDKKGFKRIIAWLREHDKNQVADEVEAYLESSQLQQLYHVAKKLNKGKLVIDLLDPPSAEIESILTKMGAAFDLAYKRFEDLKKAEAQTREAQIEAALEKVRSRSLAMQHSEELQEAAIVLFEQVKALGFETGSCGFNIWEKEEKAAIVWVSSPEGGLQLPFKLPHTKSGIYKAVYTAKQNGDEFLRKELIGKALAKHFDYLITVPGIGTVIQKLRDSNYAFPELIVFQFAFFKQGYLSFHCHQLDVDAKDIFIRFAKVFEQTYTRFLDLKKAEALTRETQIELSLERIRAQVTAMQQSTDLLDIVVGMHAEFTKLGHEAHYFWHMQWLPEKYDKAMTSGDGSKIGMVMQLPRHIHGDIPLLSNWEKSDEPSVVYAMDVDAALDYVDKMVSLGDFKQVDPNAPTPDDIRHIGGLTFIMARTTHGEIGYSLPGEVPNPPKEGIATLIRFAGVFDLAYKRFEDLQKSEKRARETKIELALEKVRSRTMAMQHSDELPDAANVLFLEMQGLGIPAWSAGYNILAEDKKSSTCIMSSEGEIQVPFVLPLTEHSSLMPWYEAIKNEQEFFVYEQGGDDLVEHYNYMATIPGLDQVFQQFKDAGISLPTFQINHLVRFTNGFLLFITYEAVPDAHEIFKRFGKVFEQTYTRFLDLQNAEKLARQAQTDLENLIAAKKKTDDTLTELRATQTQLVQSEKMASLGELTAGIAHEIQNPLNFVNNFSEVSKELLDEMKEALEKGDTEEAREIMNDVIQNLEKINHHGKRADGIVKGMLQHSRSSSGSKEPTDINALADEYLRLAYHGLRAKDKSFNASMKTEFDPSLEKVNVIPQDMGRVILNLITNAFYVVNEKKKSGMNGYEPTVTVSTKKNNGMVVLSVRDNGNGIPQKVLGKIFQPFFTTKPTGLGTGLGLSLAYDIVKSHGGDLKVETKEGEGSEFVISLQVV